MVSLLALGRASAEEAKWWYRGRFGAHVGTLCFAGVGVFVPQPIDYFVVVLALVSEVVARFCHHRALHWHSLSRETKRFALLEGAIENAPIPPADLRSQFNARLTKYAESFLDEGYYSSTRPKGPERLRELLQEIAFYSHYLYQAAAWRALVRWLAVTIFTVVAALMLIPAIGPTWAGQQFQIARIFIVFLAFLPASEEFDNMLVWYDAAKATAATADMLESADAARFEVLMLALAGYSATTEAAPPIGTFLYTRDREHIKKLWNSHLAARVAKKT